MDFTGDCAHCVGLCCVALARTRDGGFGADDAAGTPCRNLLDDHRCAIHATLRADGWPACTVFDCFGAGQQVTQVTFGGRIDWRTDAGRASEMFGTFAVMRHLMEMLRLMSEGRELVGELVPSTGSGTTSQPSTTTGRPSSSRPLAAELGAVTGILTSLVNAPAPDVQQADLAQLRGRVGPLLAEVSRVVREPVPTSRRLKPRANLLGANLRGKDLSRHDLRSALLIAADLRDCRFDRTDLLGADLRDARLHGADLSGAIFLTQQQVSAALGDASTRLPAGLVRPSHW